MVSIHPAQSSYIPGYITPTQTGIDMNILLPMLIQVMMVALMMKMMTSAVGGISGGKKKPIPVKAS
jgi:hypothetical protein